MNYGRMVVVIANLSHQKFLEIYGKVNNGTRIKITKDKMWIKKYGTDQADIAKLNYFELPDEWKNSRWLGAKMALDVLLKEIKLGNLLDEKFVEHASNAVHEEWLGRNSGNAKDEHKLSYEQLSEKAKEKDRLFVRAAIEIYEKEKKS